MSVGEMTVFARVASIIISLLFKFLDATLLRKPRVLKFRDFNIVLAPRVFPPVYTVSTELFSTVLEALLKVLKPRTVCEIGSGSGALSLVASKHASYTVACDIDVTAAVNTLLNAKLYGANIDVVVCESGNCFRNSAFDIAFSNPPYLRLPWNDTRLSCGVEGSAFIKILLNLLRISKRAVAISYSTFTLVTSGERSVFCTRGVPGEDVCVKVLFL